MSTAVALLEHLAAITKLTVVKMTPGVKGAAAIVVDDSVTVPGMAGGLSPEREIPTLNRIHVLAITSVVLMAPMLAALAFYLPVLNFGLLAFGGWFLAKEGFEKIPESFSILKNWTRSALGKKDAGLQVDTNGFMNEPSPAFMNGLNWLEQKTPGFTGIPRYMRWLKAGSPLEVEKIASASKIQLPLTAEILIIALSKMGLFVAGTALGTIAATSGALAAVSIGVISGVYFLAKRIVKVDDYGLKLANTEGTSRAAEAKRKWGRTLVSAMPHVLDGLKVVATGVLLSVGGEAFFHGLEGVAHGLSAIAPAATHAVTQIVTTVLHGGMAATTAIGVGLGGATMLAHKYLTPHAHVQPFVAPAEAPVAQMENIAQPATVSPQPQPALKPEVAAATAKREIAARHWQHIPPAVRAHIVARLQRPARYETARDGTVQRATPTALRPLRQQLARIKPVPVEIR
jgi:predicted DNA repair protein MutK